MVERFRNLEQDEEIEEIEENISNKQEEELNYFEDLEYNVNSLDIECDNQHIINMRYHELFCEKIDIFNEEKRQTKIKDTQLKAKFGELWIKYKSSKIDGKNPTDKVVEGEVLNDKDYKKIQDEYFKQMKNQNDAEKKMNVLEGVVKSFQQRKNMIEKRIDLYALGYNGEIKQRNTAKKVSDSIHDRLNKKKKS